MTTTATAESWISEIATRAKVDQATALAVLDRYGVKPQAALPRRRFIAVQSIAFEGVKTGTSSDGFFRFAWNGLSSGLWALISDRNLRGKSSVLRLILGALRGDWPEHVKDDIWKWLRSLQVDYSVDGVPYRAALAKAAGAENRLDARCVLSRLEDGQALPIYDGPPGKAFEAAVNEVFQYELGFAEIKAFNKETGSDASHGWQAMAGALYINGPGKAIFGEVNIGAMPLRLLQLFMGLPWISTYTQALTAQKSMAHRTLAGPPPLSARHGERLAALETRLAAARARVQDANRRPALRERLAELDGLLVRTQYELTDARRRADDLKVRRDAAGADLAEARRTLQQIKDERAAGLVFRSLRPVCCPSCESGIDSKRYETAGGLSCALCGSEQDEGAPETDHLAIITADMADFEREVTRLSANLRAAEAFVRGREDARSGFASESAAIAGQLSASADQASELEVVSIEAQIAQLRELIAEEQPSVPRKSNDKGVLDAAVSVTESLFKVLQDEILMEVSSVVTTLSQRFGIQNLSSIEITSGGTTKVMQGGAQTSFSNMTKGEKLRMRIAAALAVIEVARSRHYGRHPGLLLLDSPAAEEMSDEDFAQLIRSIGDVVAAADDIQVIVGAVAKVQLLEVVPSARTRHAKGDEFLF